MTMLRMSLPMVSVVKDCMKRCEDHLEARETVRCTTFECPMRFKGANCWELPIGDRNDASDMINTAVQEKEKEDLAGLQRV